MCPNGYLLCTSVIFKRAAGCGFNGDVNLNIVIWSERFRKVMSSPMSLHTRSGSSFRLCAAFCSYIFLMLFAASALGQQPQLLLGDTTVEISVDKNPGGTPEAFPVQALSTGQVTSLSVFLDTSSTATTVWVGMYANSNGHPSALLSSGVISNPLAGQWNSIPLPPVQVTGGTTYWLALLGVDGVVAFRDRTGRCRSEASGQTDLRSLPAAWTRGSSWPTCVVSMFENGIVRGGTPAPSVSISISPHAIALPAGRQQQFAAAVNGLTNPKVTWVASSGSITSAGLYTAPSSPGTYSVTATAATSRRRSSATAVASDSAAVTVTVPNPTPPPSAIAVTLSPTAASLQTGQQQQFSATVSGTTNSAVAWSASSGTITANGLYTAPAVAGTYTITAISNADNTKSASALVVVSVPQQVAVTISPANASVTEAGQLQFAAAVSGLSNKAVTWAVSRGTGTITQTGLYTAPKATETDVITATSQSDNTKSATASISVLLPHSVSLSWDASSSTDVAFYRVYRGTGSGGPYSLLNSNIKATAYTDSSVQSGNTYYYVTTAVDTTGVESIFSNEMPSVIPAP